MCAPIELANKLASMYAKTITCVHFLLLSLYYQDLLQASEAYPGNETITCVRHEKEESFKGSNQRMRLSGVCNRAKFDVGYWKAKNTSDFCNDRVSFSLSPSFVIFQFPLLCNSFNSINEAAAFHCGLILLLLSICTSSSSISMETTRYVFFSLSLLL